MKIASLSKYSGDLTLRWLNGIVKKSNGAMCVNALFHTDNGESVGHLLPFGMLPFLMPGLVVSRGNVLTTRQLGKKYKVVIPDLSHYLVVPFPEAVSRTHYDLGGHLGGDHRVLRYSAKGHTVLIPAMEMIRFLFLHGKVMANAILQPMGLMDLAITPLPGIYSEIFMEFQMTMPHAFMRPELVQEFAWAAVHPDGRKSWDSVFSHSQGQRSLMFKPPPVHHCAIEFRGVFQNNTWLVLEIVAMSGRLLPAQRISWSHPSVRARDNSSGVTDDEDERGSEDTGKKRPVHVIDRIIDDQVQSQDDVNQAVVFLGGKRGEFENPAQVIKVRKPSRPGGTSTSASDHENRLRNTRSDAGQIVDPDLPPTISVRQVSMGESEGTKGLPPLEVSVLEPLEEGDASNFKLLIKILRLVEQSKPDLTLSIAQVPLKTGFHVVAPQRRRSCLVAVFTSTERLPRVLLDVDHLNLSGGLSGLILCYNRLIVLADVERHVKILLDRLVENSHHWDKSAEREISNDATVMRFPKLARDLENQDDDKYVRKWSKKLESMLWIGC